MKQWCLELNVSAVKSAANISSADLSALATQDDWLNQFVAGKGPLVLIGFDDGCWQGVDCWAVGRVVPVLWNSGWAGAVESL